MARRSGSFLLTCIALAVVGVARVPAASAAQGKRSVPVLSSLRFSSLKLAGSNGYSIEVLGVEFDRQHVVSLAASKGSLAAEYEVPATSPGGIHGTFASLGAVSLRFKRSHRSVKRLSPTCRIVTEKGAFRGSVRFQGESAYTEVETDGGPGKVERFPDGFCGFDDRVNPGRIQIPFLSTDLTALSQANGDLLEFGASRLNGTSIATFNASLRERLGAMAIHRTASARGGAGTFVTRAPGEQPRSATVSPPRPFQGSATLEQPGAASMWTGSLSVQLPGAPLTSLAGVGWSAALCPRSNPLHECGKPSSAKEAAPNPRPSAKSGSPGRGSA